MTTALVVVVAWLVFGLPRPRLRRRPEPPSPQETLAARYGRTRLGREELGRSWVEMECVCCPGSPTHVPLWRKVLNKLR